MFRNFTLAAATFALFSAGDARLAVGNKVYLLDKKLGGNQFEHAK